MTLSFDTNNDLPLNASIIVQVPQKIPKIYKEVASCWAVLNNVPVYNKCYFFGDSIFYRDLFSAYKDNPNFKAFTGRIELRFKILNPADNEDLKVNAYDISIYDDANVEFGIDELKDTLLPMLGCEYPCKTCSPSDPYHCTSCLPSKKAP